MNVDQPQENNSLILTDIEFAYPGSAAPQLSQFSMRVEHGSCTALIGPSGCAKTTVLRIIAGLEIPASGSVVLGEKILSAKGVFISPEERNIGLVFQDYALFPHLTVSANVAYGLHKIARSERKERINEVLALVGLTDYKKRYPYQLSGGQQQRVALARALAPRPSFLLLDEPFSNLDAELRVTMRNEIKILLNKANITSLLVTHDIADARVLADTIVEMQ